MTTTFLDTNVLIYAFDTSRHAETARALLKAGGHTGIQNLNEFAYVARRKLAMSWPEIRDAISQIGNFCEQVALTRNVHDHGVMLVERYNLSVFDGFVIAAALQAGCDTLLSQDMHDGLVVDGALTIRNPFR